mmetsp:Transcript_31519/g.84108  ORF Transcript_31519/g.84108 Transcript_31519/m.84108 type:complete len:317 (-) Transcript_31519:214-1164(-)|eukprot:CAMPEP_0194486954 /NCGR_PEP_ID=MMETSP0253-20130528/7414_1 /TAXON_ID=2966 /ORGANISM="Noctiluca scintillans" /LENGTH=316 /DNA_ID=CAMNT_0039327109 /DNA_START=52 /DNA_END=1002 /DNA_ORIENTATION=-
MIRILWFTVAWASADPVELCVEFAAALAIQDPSVHLLQREVSASRRQDSSTREVRQLESHGTNSETYVSSPAILFMFVGIVLFVILGCLLCFFFIGDTDNQEEKQSQALSARLPPTGRPSTNQPAASTLKTCRNPPPICASLVLPHTEARFMVNCNTLRAIPGSSIPIMGTSGRQLLHSWICETDTEQILRIASLRCEDDPRVSIHAPRASSTQGMQITGRHGVGYGILEETQLGTFAVFHEQAVVMTLTYGNDQDSKTYEMTIRDAEGTLIAVAGTNVSGGPDTRENMWRVTVKPAVDAVLVLACALALIVLRHP